MAAGFRNSLIVEPVSSRKNLLKESLIYETYISPVSLKRLGFKHRIEVPEGFKTDFATIPRLVWPLLPPFHSDYGKAAVLHDYCYQTALFNKAWADRVFLEALGCLGCPRLKKWLLFASVKFFGKGKY